MHILRLSLDEGQSAALLSAVQAKMGDRRLTIVHAEGVERAVRFLAQHHYSLLLADLPLFHALHAHCPPDLTFPPTILIATQTEEAEALRLCERGDANDYLLATELTHRLAPALILNLLHAYEADRYRHNVGLFRRFINGTPHLALGVINRNMERIFAEGGALRVTGLTADTITGHSWHNDPRWQAHDEALQAMLRGEPRTFDVTVQGRLINLQLHPIWDDAGGVIGGGIIVQDITARHHAEEALNRRQMIEQTIATLSTDLVTAGEDDFDAVLNRALRSLGEISQADHAYFYKMNSEWNVEPCAHEWRRSEDIPTRLGQGIGLSLHDLPWTKAQYIARRAVPIDSLDDLPPEAAPEHKRLTSINVKSVLSIPLIHGEEILGFVSLNMYTKERHWAMEDVASLRVGIDSLSALFVRRRTLQALLDSERRFQSIVANAPLFIFTLDERGSLTFAAGRGLTLLIPQYTAGDLESVERFFQGMPWMIESFDRALWGDMFSTLLRMGEDNYFNTWFIPQSNQGNRVQQVMGIALDVTERFQAERAEREQRVLAEALRETTAAISSTLDSEIIIARILDSVGRVVPNEGATILVYDGDAMRIAGVRMDNPILREMFERGERLPQNISTQEYMLNTGKACLISDVHAPDNVVPWAQLRVNNWTESYLGVPIFVGGEVIGSLNLDSSIPGFFKESHAELLKVFADQAGNALYNAGLYERVKMNAEPLAALVRLTTILTNSLNSAQTVEDVADQIQAALQTEFPHAQCKVYYVRLDDSPSPDSLPQGIARYALENTETIYAPEVNFDSRYVRTDPDVRTEIAIPLITTTAVIGVLDVTSTHRAAFSDHEQRVLTAFSGRAAAAIESVMLYDAVQRHASDLETRVAERTAALDRERTQLNAILESMGEGVLNAVIGADTEIKYANSALIAMLGYTLDELIAMRPNFPALLEETHKQSQFAMQLVAAVRGKGFAQENIKLTHRDGTKIDTQLTVTPIRWLDDNLFEGVILVRDVSKQRALESQRERFIANASHELRTPITNFKMRLYLIRKQPEKALEHMNVLETAADRMQELVDDLLDVSRFERGIVELDSHPYPLDRVIREVVATQMPHADQKQQVIRMELPDTPIINHVDWGRISQVITNLLVNAINYTPEKGIITIALRLDQHKGMTYTVISVADTGIGIRADQLTHIFEPFFRSKLGTVRGTGLGLTISQEITRLHGGDIHVRSVEGVGTTFTVLLPFITA
ncbi:MAG: GAF domain-containing protein [Anaerolineales bacterium]|nr:GAF domain-containing protein [Anaerolineales bacterium]